MAGVIVLIVLLGIAFGAGYFTREFISSKRRAEARRWRDYIEPDWLPANTSEIANAIAAMPVVAGELGQMLNRWESRARARRAG
ncbi:hypothetical protein JJB98_09930 [Bradyrhizobium diazoefficiens]|nr:hypothetical protein [Bradyrhizobium diazoefficiens]QQO20214.1 hypothetical protein JJB98_09930 [Bradyrhizobium diazoefficiens]